MSLFSHGNSATVAIVTTRNVQYAFDYRQLLLPVYLLYTIPSFVAYHRCRAFMSQGRMSSCYFTHLFANDFIINVVLFIIDFLFTRLPISGLFVNFPSYVPEGVPAMFIYFLSYYLIYANFFSITLICLNRMTSVVFPYACNSFWARWHLWAIAGVYLLPLLTTWQMLTYDPYFLPLYDNQSSFQMVYRTTVLIGWLPRNSTNLCFISIVLSVVCVVANFATILKYKTTMKAVQGVNVSSWSAFHKKRTRRVEITMFACALVVCLSLVLQAVLQALIMFYGGSSGPVRATCQDLRAFALDVAICCPPWILYYNVVHAASQATVGNGSAVMHSGVGGAPPTKTHQMA